MIRAMIRTMVAGVLGVFASGAWAQPVFEVTMPIGGDEVFDGRLVVSLISEDSALFERAQPSRAPFFSDPQPMFSINVNNAKAGEKLTLHEFAEGFPGSVKALPFGTYKAQAVFDRHHANSSWRREPGNLYSEVAVFEYGDGGAPVVALDLDASVGEMVLPQVEGVEWVEIRSALLSTFRSEDVVLRAGVVLPKGWDASKSFPAIYVVPGFGGDHTSASFYGRMLESGQLGEAQAQLHEVAAHVVLDPEGPNGHHLFADSANNGPMGRALVEELIPAIESRFGFVSGPGGRIVTGHSSGGWSSLWLGITRPDVFGACFSSAPDPVDFNFFQQVNIYKDASLYTDAEGNERASSTRDGEVTMTIREENLMEEVLGPNNTSAQQWDSWFAVFGPRGKGRNPADLLDVETGKINRDIAEQYRAFDITDRLRQDPEIFGPGFANNVRLIVGREDTYDLDLAVESLLRTLAGLGFDVNNDNAPGYITIVDGADHGSIRRTEAGAAFPREMLEFFEAGGHAE